MKDIYFCGSLTPQELIHRYPAIYVKESTYAGDIFYRSLFRGIFENGGKTYLTLVVDNAILRDCKTLKVEGFDPFYIGKRKNKIVEHYYRFVSNIVNLKRFHRIHPDGIAVFNVLRIGSSISGLICSRVLKIKTIGIVTDVPGHRLPSLTKGLKGKIYDWLTQILISRFNAYVVLSEEMIKVIDKNMKKPYVVIEGVYASDYFIDHRKSAISKELTVVYAGSLHYQYGIMNLVNAVRQINSGICLKIYGDGQAKEEIKKISEEDRRIFYCGIVSHDEIVRIEREADVLVNPRPIEDEYVKYSFPSKNMEYLASGTPTLLTNIPSLPQEYKEYAYIVKNNSVEEMKNALCQLMDDRIYSEFLDKAKKAREFILTEKNPRVQARKMMQLFD